MKNHRVAVVLCNLGGPERITSVKPFLFNLFFDKNIIAAPLPIRYLLAKFISWKREKKATEIYQKIGGKSPIREETEAQAKTLEALLQSLETPTEYRVFTVMRYWHPRADEVIQEVKHYNPSEIFLLPLYPQYSTTTTQSSLAEWKEQATKHALSIPTKALCCYATHSAFIAAHCQRIMPLYEQALAYGKPRLLFSAHGLPKRVIEKGDPYQGQVEQTAAAIVKVLSAKHPTPDYTVCYQSKVGPLQWIGPATEEEIMRAARERTPVVIVPIAFVSEHSETLVELDIFYKEMANRYGLEAYFRAPALGSHPKFIEALASLITEQLNRQAPDICSFQGTRICSEDKRACPMVKIAS